VSIGSTQGADVTYSFRLDNKVNWELAGDGQHLPMRADTQLLIGLLIADS
jgi:hypothetical protein